MSSVPTQATLEGLWLDGRGDTLSALAQLQVWALREAWREFQDSDYGLQKFIVARVSKIDGTAVTGAGVHQHLERVDGDKRWFPGKHYRVRNGPTPALRGACGTGVDHSIIYWW